MTNQFEKPNQKAITSQAAQDQAVIIQDLQTVVIDYFTSLGGPSHAEPFVRWLKAKQQELKPE